MKLYEIDKQITDCIDQETGEILDVDRLDSLQMERTRKLENVACWIKNLSSDAEQLRQEEKNLAARRRAIENRQASLKQFLKTALNGEKLNSARASVSYRASSAVDVSDESACLDFLMENGNTECFNQPTVRKTELRALIESGAQVPGASIISNISMIIK